jgi:hypothetical protein
MVDGLKIVSRRPGRCEIVHFPPAHCEESQTRRMLRGRLGYPRSARARPAPQNNLHRPRSVPSCSNHRLSVSVAANTGVSEGSSLMTPMSIRAHRSEATTPPDVCGSGLIYRRSPSEAPSTNSSSSPHRVRRMVTTSIHPPLSCWEIAVPRALNKLDHRRLLEIGRPR